jgi:hypothetical protein
MTNTFFAALMVIALQIEERTGMVSHHVEFTFSTDCRGETIMSDLS